MNNFFKIFLTLLLCAAIVYFGFVGIIVMALSGADTGYFIAFILLAFELLIFITLFIWKRNILKNFRKLFAGVVVATILIGLATYAYEEYVESFVVLSDRGINPGIYEPFKKQSKLARLPHPAALKLQDDLPRIDCATALYPIAAAFVEAVYPERNYSFDNQKILTQTTTRKAFNRLAEGEVDIIFAAAPSQAQIDEAKEKGITFNLIAIGKEAFVFFVNTKNPIETLTIEQIQNIYTGSITNWQQVGGKNQEIKAFQREKNSGSQTRLEKMMDGKPLMPAPESETRGGMGGIIRRIADYKNYNNSLGFSFRYYATEMVQNKQIKLLKINGIEPAKETIRSGSYPLTGEIYAITANSNNPHLEEFLAWILSDEGQKLIEGSGYVSIK